MKIKICGITRPAEAQYLNAAAVDYAGFVFHPPSKRNVTIPQAKDIMESLNPGIKRVAVLVSPDTAQIEELQEAGFDLLQIHGDLRMEAVEHAKIPLWYAVNIADPATLAEKTEFLASLPSALREKIIGIVVDGAEYGGGKTFDWTDSRWRDMEFLNGRSLILAGGLSEANVQTGIRLFSPDVVDVSSGVEGENGKDEKKLNAFIRKVREHE
ncbi:MAG: phosphoribosylanthranilate isomerase [Agathobacter sp.]|nr:phosphoribosylanthranilate isomerase [Agathobacter sp.]